MKKSKEKIDWRLILLVCSLIVATLMGIRNSAGLFLEPISLPKDLTESLIEKENKTPINWTGDVND